MSTTASAATSLVTHLTSLPSVQQIFDTSREIGSLNASQIWSGGLPLDPSLYYNAALNQDLTWPIGFLWPQLNVTGPVNPINCTVDTCSLIFGSFLYLPNVPANAFFAAMFAIILIVSTGLSIWGRNWGYMGGMIGGLLLEILGYIGRIMLNGDDFSGNPFYIYIVCLTIGPAFLSASIYLCLARIVVVYGKDLSRFRPRTYTYIFIACDFVSLVLQGTGGGLAASFTGGSPTSKAGVNLMIAGLAFQVFSLTVFMALCADLALRIHRHRSQTAPEHRVFRHSSRFQGFLVALAVATVAIFVRSVFRVAELQAGFSSQFANNEVTFMVLEAGMISIAVIALVAFHPAVVFGRQFWSDLTVETKAPAGAKASLRSKESVGSDMELASEYRNRGQGVRM